jgi:EAL domain-containing protein (putative c-di-GMP-specific phosphodiesterase class I)
VAYWSCVAANVEAPVITDWTYLALMVVPTASLWVRVAVVKRNRAPFAALALGLTLWTAGSVAEVVTTTRGGDLPFPSVSDALWLSQYPLAVYALLSLARRRLPRVPTRLAYDAVAITAVTTALVVAVVLPPVLHNASGLDVVAQAVNLAFAVGDAILLAIAITVTVLVGRRAGIAWPLLCLAAGALTTADTFWAVAAAKHGWQPIMASNAVYPIWPLLLATVAWIPGSRHLAVVLSPADLRIIAATLLAAVIGLGILVTNEWLPVHPAAALLAGVAVLAAINRVGFRLADGVASARELGRERVLIDRVRLALERQELFVQFQPLVSTATRRAVGAEALVRWRHAGTVVPPGDFIPVIERSELREALTLFVLDEALRANADWRSRGCDIGVSVNLAAGSLVDPGLAARVQRLLEKHNVPAERLTLEVTETAAVEDEVVAAGVAGALVELGVEISIDDFGTGHSSLARIAGFPISEVKIDQLFVKALDSSPRPLVATTIQLAHTLGLRVVAEGVEERAVLNALRGLGCDIAQGYFISAPLDPEAFVRWLEEHSVVDDGLNRVDDLLQQIVAELDMDAAFVAEFVGDREVFRAVAGDPGIEAAHVGGELPLAESYCQRVAAGVFPNVIPDAQNNPLTRDMPMTATGIGAYIGTPLRHEDGAVYGTLCCLSQQARSDLGGAELARLEQAAEQLKPLLPEAGLAFVRRVS